MHTLILIPAQYQTQANAAAESMQHAMDGTTNGRLIFTIPLFGASSMEDTLPLFYWCSVVLTDANHAACEALLPSYPGALLFDYDGDANPTYPQTVLAANSLRIGQVEPLF